MEDKRVCIFSTVNRTHSSSESSTVNQLGQWEETKGATLSWNTIRRAESTRYRLDTGTFAAFYFLSSSIFIHSRLYFYSIELQRCEKAVKKKKKHEWKEKRKKKKNK